MQLQRIRLFHSRCENWDEKFPHLVTSENWTLYNCENVFDATIDDFTKIDSMNIVNIKWRFQNCNLFKISTSNDLIDKNFKYGHNVKKRWNSKNENSKLNKNILIHSI